MTYLDRSALSLPGREFCLSSRDRVAYWAELRKAFPELVCFIEHPGRDLWRDKPPRTKLYHRQLPKPGNYVWLNFIFEPDWEPVWERRKHSWYIVNKPYPNAVFDHEGNIVSADADYVRAPGPHPEVMVEGRIYFRCKRDDREQLSRARKCLGLLRKVATNKIEGVDFATGKVMWRAEKGASFWVGHDAARWCLEKKNRSISYNQYMRKGYRPLAA